MPDFVNTDIAELMFGASRTPAPLMLERVQHVGSTQEIRDHIDDAIGGVEWADIWEHIEDSFPELFAIKLGDVLASTLNECHELHRYMDTDKYPSGKPVQVPLGDYTFVSTHKPRLEILVDGIDAGAIELSVRLEFRLEAAVVRIRGGVIRGLDTGTGSVKGSISVGKIQVWESDAAQGALPGHIEFTDGIPLSGRVSGEHPNTVAEPIAPTSPTTAQVGRATKGDPAIVRRRSWLPTLALFGGFALLALVVMKEPNTEVRQPTQAAVESYALTIVTEPDDANVSIIGLDQSYTPGMRLPPGRYDIEVSRPGYQPQQQTVRLGKADLKFPVQLVESIRIDSGSNEAPLPWETTDELSAEQTRPQAPRRNAPTPPRDETTTEVPSPGTYAVTLRSDPPGADIWIKGVGNYEPGMRLPPGEYTIRLRLKGYQTTWESITVRNRDISERFELPKSFF